MTRIFSEFYVLKTFYFIFIFKFFFFFRFLCFRFSFRETLLPWRDRQYESYWAFDRIVNKVDISMIIY